MTKKLRFTGEWPPASILTKYPNWEYALEEEGVEGQDETTLNPYGAAPAVRGWRIFRTR